MAAPRPEPPADEPRPAVTGLPVRAGKPDEPPDPSPAAAGAAEPTAPAGRVARAGRRVTHAAVVARDASVAALVAALTPVVRAVGVLLAVVLTLVVVPAVLLLLVAWWRPGPADWFWTVVALAGLGLGGWLLRRRRELLATVADREQLVAALTRVVQGRDMADRVAERMTGNLTAAGAQAAGRAAAGAVRGSRGLRLLRGMWQGVQVTGVVDVLLATEQIAPLTPGRVRGLGVLTVGSAIAAAVLWVCLAVAVLAFLAGA